jgi:hypothetical protein
MNNEPIWVSDDQRRLNSRAVQRRDTWRRQYHDVVRAIKLTKQQLRDADRTGTRQLVYNHRVIINSLRQRAHELMAQRQEIALVLKITSYPYAERG